MIGGVTSAEPTMASKTLKAPVQGGVPDGLVEIILKHPHEHDGTLRPVGATLRVWPDQAARIQAAEAALDASHSDQ